MKKVSDRKTRRSRYFSTGRSRMTRRLRIFQRNHLLDFENFLKKCPTERPADRGISRPAGRERLADCGSSSVITSWTLKIFGKKCPTERPADRSLPRPAGRERLADRGFFLSDYREHTPGLGIFYGNRLFGEEVTLPWKKRPVKGLFRRARSRTIHGRGSLWSRSVENHLQTRVSLAAFGREPSADQGLFGRARSRIIRG